MFKISLIIFLIYFIALNQSSNNHISKRSIIFPRNSVLQFTIGLSVPAVLPSRTIILSLCAQVNFNLPNNVTQLNYQTIQARQNEVFFDISRLHFYKYLSNLLSSFGLNGEQCVLRSVCEIAEIPLDVQNDNLLEKIVHFIFTPSSDIQPLALPHQSDKPPDFLQKLIAAENLVLKMVIVVFTIQIVFFQLWTCLPI